MKNFQLHEKDDIVFIDVQEIYQGTRTALKTKLLSWALVAGLSSGLFMIPYLTGYSGVETLHLVAKWFGIHTTPSLTGSPSLEQIKSDAVVILPEDESNQSIPPEEDGVGIAY